jgi:hypothetical protein
MRCGPASARRWRRRSTPEAARSAAGNRERAVAARACVLRSGRHLTGSPPQSRRPRCRAPYFLVSALPIGARRSWLPSCRSRPTPSRSPCRSSRPPAGASLSQRSSGRPARQPGQRSPPRPGLLPRFEFFASASTGCSGCEGPGLSPRCRHFAGRSFAAFARRNSAICGWAKTGSAAEGPEVGHSLAGSSLGSGLNAPVSSHEHQASPPVGRADPSNSALRAYSRWTS